MIFIIINLLLDVTDDILTSSTFYTDGRGILAIDNQADYETKANYSLQLSVGTDVGTMYKVAQVTFTSQLALY